MSERTLAPLLVQSDDQVNQVDRLETLALRSADLLGQLLISEALDIHGSLLRATLRPSQVLSPADAVEAGGMSK